MIQTYTWHVEMPAGTPFDVAVDRVRKASEGIMAYTTFLKGAIATVIYSTTAGTPHKLAVSMRISGKDRWAAQMHAKQVGEKVLKAAGLWTYPIEHVSTVTEPNRRGLKDGEGRTPRPRPPRPA